MKNFKQNDNEERRRSTMKQLIVLIAMIILGIAIAGFIVDFQDKAKSIAETTNGKISMSVFGKTGE